MEILKSDYLDRRRFKKYKNFKHLDKIYELNSVLRSKFLTFSFFEKKILGKSFWQEGIIDFINKKIIDYKINNLIMICSSKLKSKVWQVLAEKFYLKNCKNQKKFSIIVATDEKKWIWKNNDLAWKLSADLKNFKKITGEADNWKINAVVMWRKTWESIPNRFKPLPGRKNFILSSQKNFLDWKKIPWTNKNFSDEVKIFSDFEIFLQSVSKDKKIDKIFVIWWWEIYKSVINHKNCEKIFLTKVFWDFWCDKFFPEIPKKFEKFFESEVFEEDWIKFVFQEFFVEK